jgi:DNA-binding Lrp family transcriptional regulator
MLNHEKLGYDLTAIIDITATKGRIVDLEKQIAKFPNVCAV